MRRAPDRLSPGSLLLPSSQISSAEEAVRTVELAERAYMQALARYRQLTGVSDGSPVADPLSLLTALEGLLAASQEAVRLAPGSFSSKITVVAKMGFSQLYSTN